MHEEHSRAYGDGYDHLSILYLRCMGSAELGSGSSILTSFNSLFEMPQRPKRPLGALCASFNSLFEMRNGAYRHGGHQQRNFQFSI